MRRFSRIGQGVSCRENQISLIEERASARVFHAIRGAREQGRRINSGLHWLGDIPDSWKIAPVYSQYDVRLGKMLNPDRAEGDHSTFLSSQYECSMGSGNDKRSSPNEFSAVREGAL